MAAPGPVGSPLVPEAEASAADDPAGSPVAAEAASAAAVAADSPAAEGEVLAAVAAEADLAADPTTEQTDAPSANAGGAFFAYERKEPHKVRATNDRGVAICSLTEMKTGSC